MNLSQAEKIAKFYQEVEVEYSAYLQQSGLTCPPQCGKCCINPDISARPFETVLLALKIIKGELPGGLEFWVSKLKNSKTCVFYNGSCLSYAERPLVCRTFGAVQVKDKYGEPVLSVCKELKELKPHEYRRAKAADAPDLNQTLYQLLQLAPGQYQDLLPLNQAVLVMMQQLLNFLDYSSLQS